MASRFVLNPIENAQDLMAEKQRLKLHIARHEEQLIQDLEALPANVVTGFVLRNSGKAIKTVGSVLLAKLMGPTIKKVGLEMGSAASSKNFWSALAANAGMFVASELLEKYLNRKQSK